MELFYSDFLCDFWRIRLFSDGDSLCRLKFVEKFYDDGEPVENLFLGAAENNELEIFNQTKILLKKYFAGEKVSCQELKLKTEGTDFQKSVWKILKEIPYGKTLTYGDIAKQIAAEKGIKKMSAQAVGNAVGKNPLPIIVPCHRVLAAGNKLGGYTGGTDIKIRLLKIEKINYS